MATAGTIFPVSVVRAISATTTRNCAEMGRIGEGRGTLSASAGASTPAKSRRAGIGAVPPRTFVPNLPDFGTAEASLLLLARAGYQQAE
jgi:hypothetical protein